METGRDAFDKFDLDQMHVLYRGSLPGSVSLSDVQFELLWSMRPDEYSEVVMHGRPVKTPRWDRAYGHSYRYAGRTNEAAPIPSLLHPLLEWCGQRVDDRLNGLLVNWHDGALGHYHGRHRDSIRGRVVGSPIVTISFGERRIFRMRPWKGTGFIDIEAANRSVIIVPWDTNLAWTHEIPRREIDRGRRISVTLRAFTEPLRIDPQVVS